MSMVGKDAEPILMGINGKQAALYLIEDVVITIPDFQVGAVLGGQRQGATNGFHFTGTCADFVYRAAAGVGAGASRTMVRQRGNGMDVYIDMLTKLHRLSFSLARGSILLVRTSIVIRRIKISGYLCGGCGG